MLFNRFNSKNNGFTLAEVLITLGIIGIVAAMTLPTLNQAINNKVRAEQVRTVKYKFTKATEKMNSLGLIGPYASTDAFVDELQKHLKIMKRCDSSHLRECWPYDEINTTNGAIAVSSLTNGSSLMMRTNDDKDFKQLQNFFGIEFLNRINNIIYFNELKEEDIEKIIINKLDSLKKSYKMQDIKLTINKKIIKELISLTEYEKFGARRVDKVISDYIESKVIDNIIEGETSIKIDNIVKVN